MNFLGKFAYKYDLVASLPFYIVWIKRHIHNNV